MRGKRLTGQPCLERLLKVCVFDATTVWKFMNYNIKAPKRNKEIVVKHMRDSKGGRPVTWQAW